MNNNLLTIFLFVISLNLAFSQDLLDVNSVIPPSPEAASLGKYGNHDINLYSGQNQIDIPLYQINDKGMDMVSIGLNYSSNGVRVSEISSRVGLGWTMYAGGVVTRSVRGAYADDFHDVVAYDPPALDCISGLLGNFNDNSPSSVFDNDTEHDLFYFNFNGRSGKFVVLDENTVMQIPQTNLKIDVFWEDLYNSPCGNYKIIEYFKITDEEGNIYIFDQIEETQFTSGFEGFQFLSFATHRSSWYLSKIEHPYSGEINFHYSAPTSDSLNVVDEFSRSFKSIGSNSDHTCACTIDTMSQLTISHDVISIDSIVSDNYKIEISGPSRTDWLGDDCVDNFKIYYQNNLLKEISLKQSYFLTNSGSSFQEKRLRLDAIYDKGSTGTDSIPLYEFVYDTTAQLPVKNSNETDAWGYYNGNGAPDTISANGSNFQKPMMYFYPSESTGHAFRLYPKDSYSGMELIYGGYSKQSVFDYAKLGILKEIIYPTGGKSIFDYELNEFIDNGDTIKGAGLRVKKISDVPLVGDTIVREFKYVKSDGTSSGSIVGMPQLAYMCKEPRDNITFCHDIDFSVREEIQGFDNVYYIDIEVNEYTNEQIDSIIFVSNGTTKVYYTVNESYEVCDFGGCYSSQAISFDMYLKSGCIISDDFTLQNTSSTHTIDDCFSTGTYCVPDQRNLYNTARFNKDQNKLGNQTGSLVGYSRVEEVHPNNGKIVYHYNNYLTHPDLPSSDTLIITGNDCDSVSTYYGQYDKFPFLPGYDRSYLRGINSAKYKLSENGDTIHSSLYFYSFNILDTTEFENVGIYTSYPTITPEFPDAYTLNSGGLFSTFMIQDSVKTMDFGMKQSVTKTYNLITTPYSSYKLFLKTEEFQNSNMDLIENKYFYNYEYPNSMIRDTLVSNHILMNAFKTEKRVNGSLIDGIQIEYNFFNSDGSISSSPTSIIRPYKFLKYEENPQ